MDSLLSVGESRTDWSTWSIIWYFVGMVMVATLNLIVFFTLFKRTYPQAKQEKDPDVSSYRTRMLCLCMPFVLVCAWRSYFPNLYMERYVLLDVPMSSAGFSRLMATFAEPCFVAQIVMAIRRSERDLSSELEAMQAGSTSKFMSAFVQTTMKLTFCFILMAECWSWTGTITQNALFYAFEEGSWVFSAWAFVLPSLIYTYSLLRRTQARFAAEDPVRLHDLSAVRVSVPTLLVCVSFYCLWGVTLDVPLYFRQWHDQVSSGDWTKWQTNIGEGLRDAFFVWHPTKSLDDWGPYLLWLTCYFSLTCWGSMLLAWTAPRVTKSRQNEVILAAAAH
eukprot:TRINITY_DN32348_c0_g1_i1.p1 TRINITY_DN32348_c0_g1~~TRINITY_DN32348_c0_g1_i1.p1  ORF type:complete len:365 (+),score=55.95 TRINITY_DN32348_c0_g1_i1:96-1097(+)